jgi:hypothetical protein
MLPAAGYIIELMVNAGELWSSTGGALALARTPRTEAVGIMVGSALTKS